MEHVLAVAGDDLPFGLAGGGSRVENLDGEATL
jgi:hypothetical protein